MPEPTVGAYERLRRGAVVVDPMRAVVRAGGPDASTFLQGQLSQDVASLAPGASAWSWLLQPTGKVEALVRVTNVDSDTWLLDTDQGWGERVAARLTRFKLRTKVDLELMSSWSVVGLRGPDAATVMDGLVAVGGTTPVTDGAGVVATADASWPGLPGVDLIGPTPALPSGLPVLDPASWQAARIEAGIPVMGAELTERTIPAETGLIERTVSFTKGCYTGQELVARIDSRGSHVPRRLCGVRLDGPAEAGAALAGPDGAAAGVLTSVAESPAWGWVALGYARRGVEAGSEVSVEGGSRGVVDGLPLAGGDLSTP